MTTMENSIEVQHTSRGPWQTALLILNWGIFAYVAVSGLSWWAVTLMVIPYPDLMAQAGEDFGYVFANTGVFSALSLVAGIALWLLSRRHKLQWYGQTLLAVAVACALTTWLWYV